ncbi:Nn.00g064920.m01.CDS01 [Neocucurbitaria sp. VM-36]
MDYDDAIPPAIRRSPRAALEVQTRMAQRQYDYDDSDETSEPDSDDAIPPPISRSRSASLDSELSNHTPSSSINPLRAHPVNAQPAPARPPQFSRPFREQPQYVSSPAPPPLPAPSPRRRPRGLMSYRNNKKLPLHLRRQPSLETINSVTTTASVTPSEDFLDPPEAEAPSPDHFTLEDDPPATPVPTSTTSKSSSIYSWSESSRHSSTPASTPLEFTSLENHSTPSLFRKMMPHKTEEPPRTPTRLIIERTVSFDRTSHRSSLSRPNVSLQPERSLDSGFFDVERSQSGSSGEWSASSFDISDLTEAEIKKCKKKGINPALYAEMRAARKGKWTSPIAGNTFL